MALLTNGSTPSSDVLATSGSRMAFQSISAADVRAAANQTHVVVVVVTFFNKTLTTTKHVAAAID